MIKLLIAADDFTGALDTGVQFSKQGIRTLVVPSAETDMENVDGSIVVLSVNTQTRHKNKKEAYETVYRLIKRAADMGIKYIYKKTDSALRGNIGSELLAAIRGSGYDRLMFIPAYPDNNRTTENGAQYISGAPIAQTHFANDPFNPVSTSYIPDIIKQQTDVHTIIVKTGETAEYSEQCGIFIFDAKTNEDISNICHILKRSNEIRLMAGCAGCANALPEVIDFKKSAQEPSGFRGSILLVSGSLNNTSIEQMNHAKNIGFTGVTLSPEQMLKRDYIKSYECDLLVNRINGYLAENKRAYIETADGATDIKNCRQYIVDNNTDTDMPHLLIARNIGNLVKRIINERQVSNLFVFGGDTLLGIIEALDIKGVTPLSEICPGVVASKILSEKYSFNLITKAGGLGPKDAVGITMAKVL